MIEWIMNDEIIDEYKKKTKKRKHSNKEKYCQSKSTPTTG